ncbi:hypothetical protein ACFY5K_25800 [Streptomyces griseofuscus]|uniref:hypothetical protein n=1 Tax=Streptomyces griseofuscus TaxID=146922 RepID=UPI0036A83F68
MSGVGGLVQVGGVAAALPTRRELLDEISRAQCRTEGVYASEWAIVSRVTAGKAGTFYIVVEADFLDEEDLGALQALNRDLRCDWRSCLLLTERHAEKHPRFPWSNSYALHIVHPKAAHI